MAAEFDALSSLSGSAMEERDLNEADQAAGGLGGGAPQQVSFNSFGGSGDLVAEDIMCRGCGWWMTQGCGPGCEDCGCGWWGTGPDKYHCGKCATLHRNKRPDQKSSTWDHNVKQEDSVEKKELDHFGPQILEEHAANGRTKFNPQVWSAFGEPTLTSTEGKGEEVYIVVGLES